MTEPHTGPRTVYQVENARGTVVFAFDDPARAHAWLEANDHLHHGLQVIMVTTTVTRRRVDARGRYVAARAPAAGASEHSQPRN